MAAQDALQKYQDMLKKRQEQDARLSELFPDPQTSGNTTPNQPEIVQPNYNNDIINELLNIEKEKAKILQLDQQATKNEQTLAKQIANPASPINSKEDLLNKWKGIKNMGKSSPQISMSKDLLSNTSTQTSDQDYQKVGDEGFEDLANPELQQVEYDKPNAMAIELNPNQASSANLKSAVTGGPDTRDEDKIIDTEGKVITREENARREAIDEGRLPIEPPKPLTDTVSTTQAAPMTDEEKLAEAQRQRDIMAAMGLISGGISKATAGYGGGSVTQLKADTTGQDLLTQMGERGVADIKESMARASDKKKQELEDLLKKAQAAKLQFEASGKMTDKEKADVAFKNAQLGLERLKLIQETTKPQKLSQDEINTRKENRKVYREVDADKTKSQSLLDEIKQARQAFEEYSKSKFGGTGPLATAFGTTANISEDSQKLRSKFNKLSLGNMTKLFSGFSKAIDTDAERAFFQSTQPDLSLDDDVNREILKNMEDYAKGLVDKANMRQAEITKEGDFRSPEETLSEYQKIAGKNTSYPKQMTKGGKQVTVSNSQEENEARQEGWN